MSQEGRAEPHATPPSLLDEPIASAGAVSTEAVPVAPLIDTSSPVTDAATQRVSAMSLDDGSAPVAAPQPVSAVSLFDSLTQPSLAPSSDAAPPPAPPLAAASTAGFDPGSPELEPKPFSRTPSLLDLPAAAEPPPVSQNAVRPMDAPSPLLSVKTSVLNPPASPKTLNRESAASSGAASPKTGMRTPIGAASRQRGHRTPMMSAAPANIPLALMQPSLVDANASRQAAAALMAAPPSPSSALAQMQTPESASRPADLEPTPGLLTPAPAAGQKIPPSQQQQQHYGSDASPLPLPPDLAAATSPAPATPQHGSPFVTQPVTETRTSPVAASASLLDMDTLPASPPPQQVQQQHQQHSSVSPAAPLPVVPRTPAVPSPLDAISADPSAAQPLHSPVPPAMPAPRPTSAPAAPAPPAPMMQPALQRVPSNSSVSADAIASGVLTALAAESALSGPHASRPGIDSVPASEDGVRTLSQAGEWQAALQLAASLASTATRRQALRLTTARVLAMLNLKRYADAQMDIDALGDLDAPSLCEDNISLVPYSLRVCHAVLPHLLGSSDQSIRRLYQLQANLSLRMDDLEGAGAAGAAAAADAAASPHPAMTSHAVHHRAVMLPDTDLALWQQRLDTLCHLLVSVHVAEKQYQLALHQLAIVLRRQPSCIHTWSVVARVHLLAGSIDTAELVFKHVASLADAPSSSLSSLPIVQLNTGFLAVARGDFAAAQAAFDSVMQQDAKNVAARTNFALTRLFACQLSDSLRSMESAIAEDPFVFLHPALCFNLCTLYDLAVELPSDRKRQLRDIASCYIGPRFDASVLKLT